MNRTPGAQPGGTAPGERSVPDSAVRRPGAGAQSAAPQQGSKAGASPLAGLSQGLPGDDRADQISPDTTSRGGEHPADLAGPNAPTAAMSIPGRKPAGAQAYSADDRTVKVPSAQSKAAQADISTAEMSQADRPSKSDTKAGKGTAAAVGAAAAGAAVAGAAAAGARASDENRAADATTGTDAAEGPAQADRGATGAAAATDTGRGADAPDAGTAPGTDAAAGAPAAGPGSSADSTATTSSAADNGAAATAGSAATSGPARADATAADAPTGAGAAVDASTTAAGGTDATSSTATDGTATEPGSAAASRMPGTLAGGTAGTPTGNAANSSASGAAAGAAAAAGSAATQSARPATGTPVEDAAAAAGGGSQAVGAAGGTGASPAGSRDSGAAQPGSGDADAPTVSGAVAGKDVSRSGEADATEKFQTGAGSGGQGTSAGRPGGEARGAGDRPSAAAAAGAASLRKGGGEVPASEDQTIAMRVVNPADAPTTAMPVQRPQSTDRVVPSAGGRPMTPPPNTPRGPAGPRQAGHQGPAGPHGPGIEETQPSPPRGPSAPPKQASAPSPADIQPTRPAQQLAEGKRQDAPRPVAPPQRIEAPQEPAADKPARSKRWLLAVAGAAVLVIALIATVVALMTGGDNSPEGQVRTAIGDYADALRSGDLDNLRSSTCGQLHDFYQGITADQFKGVHQLSTERGSIPVVASVDAVRITGDTALAEATVYTSADPSKRTARTFDLQRTDGNWKVCDPAGTP